MQLHVYFLQHDSIPCVYWEEINEKTACKDAAKIWISERPTLSLFRASSSHHDRICFVNEASRDEGVIILVKIYDNSVDYLQLQSSSCE